MNKVKNVYSPAGMGYVASGGYRHLKDCPKCRYGTLMKRSPKDLPEFWGCIDCGHKIPIEQNVKQ